MTHTRDEFNNLFNNFKSLERKVYFPETEELDGGLTASKFAGQPWLAPDEAWPACGHCGNSLQFFFQLDLGSIPPDMRDKYGDKGLLQLFYCLNCDDYEPFTNKQLVRILVPDERSVRLSHEQPPVSQEFFPPRTITAWHVFEEFPETSELDTNREIVLDDSQRFAWDQLEKDFEALSEFWPRPGLGDKLGGWPHWIQGVEYNSCPQCHHQMQVIFQLDSENNQPYMFGDAGCSYILQCPIHREQLGFTWACM